MKLKNIDHINLTVASFPETVEWYGRVFGFQLVEEGLQDGPIRWAHNTSWYVADPTGWEIEVALWKNDLIKF